MHAGNWRDNLCSHLCPWKTQQEVIQRDREKPSEGFLAHWASPESYIKAAAWLLTIHVSQG